MREYTVYLHISPSGKRYYGVTKLNVKQRWQNGRGYKDNEDFWEAIEKYGWCNFQHIIVVKDLTKDEDYWLEETLIEAWDTRNTDKGYNIAKGGHGTNGWNPSDETKKKMSEAKMCENNYWYGKQRSEETKKKMKKNHADVSGENNPMYGKYGKNHPRAKAVICITTGRIFHTAKEGAKYYGIISNNITNCCKSKLKSAGKYQGKKLVWRYLVYNHNKIYRIKK